MTTTGWWWVPRPSRCWSWAICPVGRDFPVFLHPETREEYALARTERKSGRGYRFVVESSPNVTLEEDLSGAILLSIP